MASEERIIYRGGAGEITEKKSRFIATISPVSTEEEARAFIESVRKKYHDARHNCFAFLVDEGGIARTSDDGEPQGTAGHPMLDVLTGENLHNVAVVVTRYFGGTLLGTGGLVRAYSDAVRKGLNDCEILVRERGVKLSLTIAYTDLGKLQYLLEQQGIPILNCNYGEEVELTAIAPKAELDKVEKEIQSAAGRDGKLTVGEECWFAYRNGKAIEL